MLEKLKKTLTDFAKAINEYFKVEPENPSPPMPNFTKLTDLDTSLIQWIQAQAGGASGGADVTLFDGFNIGNDGGTLSDCTPNDVLKYYGATDITIKINNGWSEPVGIVAAGLGGGQVFLTYGNQVTTVQGSLPNVVKRVETSPGVYRSGMLIMMPTGTDNEYDIVKAIGTSSNSAPTLINMELVGVMEEGRTVSASSVYVDADDDERDTASTEYEWYEAPDNTGVPGTWTLIPGATAKDYTIPIGATVSNWLKAREKPFALTGVKEGLWYETPPRQIQAVSVGDWQVSDNPNNKFYMDSSEKMYMDDGVTLAGNNDPIQRWDLVTGGSLISASAIQLSSGSRFTAKLLSGHLWAEVLGDVEMTIAHTTALDMLINPSLTLHKRTFFVLVDIIDHTKTNNFLSKDGPEAPPEGGTDLFSAGNETNGYRARAYLADHNDPATSLQSQSNEVLSSQQYIFMFDVDLEQASYADRVSYYFDGGVTQTAKGFFNVNARGTGTTNGNTVDIRIGGSDQAFRLGAIGIGDDLDTDGKQRFAAYMAKRKDLGSVIIAAGQAYFGDDPIPA